MTHHAPQNNNPSNKIIAYISIIMFVFLVLIENFLTVTVGATE